MVEIIPLGQERMNFFSQDCPAATFKDKTLEGRIKELSEVLSIKYLDLNLEDIVIESYEVDSNNPLDAHLLIEKEAGDFIYKIVSIPADLEGEKIFKNFKIRAPIEKQFGTRSEYVEFCKKLSLFYNGHDKESHSHNLVLGYQSYNFLLFLNSFLGSNSDSAYERLRTTVSEVIEKGPGYLEQIFYGGILHDIGKIFTPSQILKAPRRLTKPEYKLVQEHTKNGSLFLKGFRGLEVSASMTMNHHSSWNSRTYREIEGDDLNDGIPLSSRICSTWDLIDAMSSNRAYKKAYSYDFIKGMFIGTHEDDRGNFVGHIDPIISQILFEEKIETEYHGKKRFVSVWNFMTEKHRELRMEYRDAI